MIVRKIIARLCGLKVVALIDFDNEISIRFAKRTKAGLLAKRLSFTETNCLLLDDGRVIGPSWVHSWKEM